MTDQKGEKILLDTTGPIARTNSIMTASNAVTRITYRYEVSSVPVRTGELRYLYFVPTA
ncbi:hypothetical protein [Escherichia coli]|uniref:hypothetical protein n=1 Tax=Escherichia coli TaxID=562 RepID=UPI00258C6E25|nr:hypothetical protein [Escherichia coli]